MSLDPTSLINSLALEFDPDPTINSGAPKARAISIGESETFLPSRHHFSSSGTTTSADNPMNINARPRNM